MRAARAFLLAAMGTLVLADTAAADRWIHLRVEESSGTKVRMNLPLAMIREVLPHLESDRLRGGRVLFESGEVAASEIEAARAALSRALAGSRVEVDRGNGRLSLERTGDLLVLTGEGRDGERVLVRVPAGAAKAVLSDLPASLDLLAVVRAFEKGPEMEIATIESTDARVRIWLDASSASD